MRAPPPGAAAVSKWPRTAWVRSRIVTMPMPGLRRDGLVEARMHPPRRGVHHQRKRIDVRALQLLQSAPLEHELRQLVDHGKLFEHFGRR